MIIALPDSRVRVTASHSNLLATGSIPVEGSSRKMTGGPPIRAIPALSFRLLPPLYMCIMSHYWKHFSSILQDNMCILAPPKSYLPVAADQFISMRLQQQRAQDILHAARHVLLRDSSEPGVHTQSFSSCHVVQYCIELRTVAYALLHL